jgi:hypothetical protein
LGTVTAVLLLDRETANPPEPALPLRVSVPVDGFPPATVDGFTLTDNSDGGTIVSVAVLEVPFRLAVIVAVVSWLTPLVVIVNVP